jgi:hypothetical protein
MSIQIRFCPKTNGWDFGQTHFDGNKTFSRVNRLNANSKETGYSLRIWTVEGSKGKFLSDRTVGELVGYCLGNGITWVEFKGSRVSVNYLTEALKFKADHGWFDDLVMDTCDHKFDGNSPTPGLSWGEGKALLAEATERTNTNYAGIARAAHRYDEADEFERATAALKQRASELMFAKR